MEGKEVCKVLDVYICTTLYTAGGMGDDDGYINTLSPRPIQKPASDALSCYSYSEVSLHLNCSSVEPV